VFLRKINQYKKNIAVAHEVAAFLLSIKLIIEAKLLQ